MFHREWDETKSREEGYTWDQALLGAAPACPSEAAFPKPNSILPLGSSRELSSIWHSPGIIWLLTSKGKIPFLSVATKRETLALFFPN